MNEKDVELLEVTKILNFKTYYRKGTTDLNCLKEVLEQKCYQRVKDNIQVDAGETWLDLGGNIGAFGLFCQLRNAKKVYSFEPDEDSVEVMNLNYSKNLNTTEYDIQPFAITNLEQSELQFFKGGKNTDRYRNTIIPNKNPINKRFKNLHANHIKDLKLDGIKMDIEGSEFGLIDENLLPKCDKLIFEYHITKDRSLANFHRRMDILRGKFKHVLYMKSLDKFDKNGTYPGFFDRVIYCKNY